MNKKTVILILIFALIVVSLIIGVFVWSKVAESRPLHFLIANQIESITVSRNYGTTLHELNEEQIKELVKILRRIIVYERDDSHTRTGGANLLVYHIVLRDGDRSNIDVMPFPSSDITPNSSTIVITGIGYRSKSKVIEELLNFENVLWTSN